MTGGNATAPSPPTNPNAAPRSTACSLFPTPTMAYHREFDTPSPIRLNQYNRSRPGGRYPSFRIGFASARIPIMSTRGADGTTCRATS